MPTDIAAGLILVQVEQKSQPRRLHLEPILTFDQPRHAGPRQPAGPNLTVQDPNILEIQSVTTTSVQSVRPAGLYDDVSGTTPVPAVEPSGAECPSDATSTQSTPQEDVFPRPKQWMNIYNAAYYMKYAMGGYGWPLYVYMNPVTGCCKLWRDCR